MENKKHSTEEKTSSKDATTNFVQGEYHNAQPMSANEKASVALESVGVKWIQNNDTKTYTFVFRYQEEIAPNKYEFHTIKTATCQNEKELLQEEIKMTKQFNAEKFANELLGKLDSNDQKTRAEKIAKDIENIFNRALPKLEKIYSEAFPEIISAPLKDLIPEKETQGVENTMENKKHSVEDEFNMTTDLLDPAHKFNVNHNAGTSSDKSRWLVKTVVKNLEAGYEPGSQLQLMQADIKKNLETYNERHGTNFTKEEIVAFAKETAEKFEYAYKNLYPNLDMDDKFFEKSDLEGNFGNVHLLDALNSIAGEIDGGLRINGIQRYVPLEIDATKENYLIEFEGDVSEDSLFNMLSEMEIKDETSGLLIDANPITPEKSGTIEEYIERIEKWRKEDMEKSKGKATANEKQSELTALKILYEGEPIENSEYKLGFNTDYLKIAFKNATGDKKADIEAAKKQISTEIENLSKIKEYNDYDKALIREDFQNALGFLQFVDEDKLEIIPGIVQEKDITIKDVSMIQAKGAKLAQWVFQETGMAKKLFSTKEGLPMTTEEGAQMVRLFNAFETDINVDDVDAGRIWLSYNGETKKDGKIFYEELLKKAKYYVTNPSHVDLSSIDDIPYKDLVKELEMKLSTTHYVERVKLPTNTNQGKKLSDRTKADILHSDSSLLVQISGRQTNDTLPKENQTLLKEAIAFELANRAEGAYLSGYTKTKDTRINSGFITFGKEYDSKAPKNESEITLLDRLANLCEDEGKVMIVRDINLSIENTVKIKYEGNFTEMEITEHLNGYDEKLLSENGTPIDYVAAYKNPTMENKTIKEIEWNGDNIDEIRTLLSEVNVAAVQINEYPFNGKAFLIGKNGEEKQMFKQDTIRIKNENVEIQKPSFLENEIINIEPLENKFQKEFFESPCYENIQTIFDVPNKKIMEEFPKAKRDADEYYEKSAMHDEGYSYQEYFASQIAREFLKERYANIQEYTNESGGFPDRIAKDIVTGKIQSNIQLNKIIESAQKDWLKNQTKETDRLGMEINMKNTETEKEIENEKKDFGIKYDWDSFPEEKFHEMMEHIADKSIRNKSELIGTIDVNGLTTSIEILHGDGSGFHDDDPEIYENEKVLRVCLPGYFEYTGTVTPNNSDLESYEGFKAFVKEDIVEEMAGETLQKDWLEEQLDISEFTKEDFNKIKDEAMSSQTTESPDNLLGRIKAGIIDVDIMVCHDDDGSAYIDLQGYYPLTDLSMSLEDADAVAYSWQGKYSNALPFKNFNVGTITDLKDKVTDYNSFAGMLKDEVADMLLDEESRLRYNAFDLKNSEIMSLAKSQETWDSLTAKWTEKQIGETFKELEESYDDKKAVLVDKLMREQMELYLEGKTDILHGGDPEKFAEVFHERAIQDDRWNPESIALDSLAAGRPDVYHAMCHTTANINPLFVEDALMDMIKKPEPDTERIKKIIATCKNEGLDDEITGMDFEIPFRAAISEKQEIMHAVFSNMNNDEMNEFLGEKDGFDKVLKQYSAKTVESEKGWNQFTQYAESCGYLQESGKENIKPAFVEANRKAVNVKEIMNRATTAKPYFTADKIKEIENKTKRKNVSSPSKSDDFGL